MFSDVFKDYVEHISTFSDTANNGLGDFLFGSVTFLVHSFVFTLTYIVSFQWLTHVHELPSVFRENYGTIIEGKNVVLQGLQLQPNFYALDSNDPADSKNLITGLLNGFFLALPCTAPQLLALRAIAVNGWPPAIALMLGTVAGQSLYMGLILFGFDNVTELMEDWYPCIIALGIRSLIRVVNDVVDRPDFARHTHTRWNWFLRLDEVVVGERVLMARQFRSMAALAFFENGAIGNYGNLTATVNPSVLETGGNGWWFVDTFGYWLGLGLGNILWSLPIFWVWRTVCYPGLLAFFKATADYSPETYWLKFRGLYSGPLTDRNFGAIRRYHQACLVGMVTLSLHSIPYYGADYLGSGPLGLIYQDNLLRVDHGATVTTVIENQKEHEDLTKDHEEHYFQISFHDDNLIYFKAHKAIPEMVPQEILSLMPHAYWEYRHIREELYEDLAEAYKETITKLEYMTPFKLSFNPLNLVYSHNLQPGLDDPNDPELEEYIEEVRGRPLLANEPTPLHPNGLTYLDILAASVFREDAYTIPMDRWDDDLESAMDGTMRLFRERCWASPVFNTMLQMEAVPLLGAQPASDHVTVDDDSALFEQRHALNHYLDSLQRYKHRRSRFFREDNPFPKYVYNQQFKGSLVETREIDHVRVFLPDKFRDDRLSAWGPSGIEEFQEDRRELREKVLSYDQTLYNRWPDAPDAVLHEELRGDLAAAPTLGKPGVVVPDHIKDRVGYRMQDTAAGPVYFGWDGPSRKLMINTSTLPVAGVSPATHNATHDDAHVPYFEFQAYPRAIHDVNRKYRLFDLNFDPEDKVEADMIERLRIIFGFLQDEFYLEDLEEWEKEVEKTEVAGDYDEVKHLSSQRLYQLSDNRPEDMQRKLLAKLPQYDWVNRRFDLDTDRYWEMDWDDVRIKLKFRPYVEMGHALPPKLAGVAWPGTIDTTLGSRYEKAEAIYEDIYYEKVPEIANEDPGVFEAKSAR